MSEDIVNLKFALLRDLKKLYENLENDYNVIQ
jgi:hypothetical protein